MSRKQRKKGNGNNNSIQLINAIIDLFASHPTQAFNYKQVAKRLHIKQDSQRARLIDILAQLAQNEELEEVAPGKYKLHSKTRYITGTLQLTSSNNAFVISDEVEEEVFIAFKNLNHALGGDTVRVYLYAKRPGRRLEGEVVEVLERKRKQFVGRVEVTKNFAFLVPESKDIPYDIFIPLNKLNKAKNGQKAVARITDWPDHVKNPFGEIVEVLGAPGKNETEIHAILAEFELPYRFPEEVLKEAEKIPDCIPAEEIKNRRDFRHVTTFTIDPIDAKDFDDAISFQILPNGNYEIGVHIADVTYYVKPGSLIDEEAYKRGTSVYLVDRVVPMLPEKLSNFVCSLRPHEDKLCYSAVFEMDANARVINQWFGRTIINSDRRFNY
ncbi:MAG TPA: RNB domain-containing ribonuclease, partial [Bacteroidales bacterium]|nr:RNB domain-containing ribonuclease [Bacteroidales bacterium]